MQTSIKIIKLFMLISIINVQLHAASIGVGPGISEDSTTTSRLITDSFAGGLDISIYLDPRSASSLRATDTLGREILPVNTVMANDCMDQIVSGRAPSPKAVQKLEALASELRQNLFHKSLIEKFGTNKIFTIRNTSLFSVDMAAVCKRVYRGSDPIIQQHNREYYIGSMNTETESERIEGQYRSLKHMIDHPEDHRIPTYLTSTQDSLVANLEAASSYFALHPNVTLVLKAAEDNPIFSLSNRDLPTALEKLSLVGDHITQIGNWFLSDCRRLRTLDLSSLNKVTQIGNMCLSNCSELSTLDLSALSKVNQIGNGFLSRCSGLTTLDLNPFGNVSEIAGYFLYGCSRLTTLDLRPLSNITQIESDFLSGCSGLKTVDFSSLSKVTQIGYCFLSGCRGLTTLDLSPFKNVTQIRDYFLSGCNRLNLTTQVAVSAFMNRCKLTNALLQDQIPQ